VPPGVSANLPTSQAAALSTHAARYSLVADIQDVDFWLSIGGGVTVKGRGISGCAGEGDDSIVGFIQE
jgi:hypothetical protein